MKKFKTLNGYEVKDEFARMQSHNALTRIGELSNLSTTDKTSIVNAINEVYTDISGDSTKIGDLTDLHTTSKTNLVSATNEVNDYAHNIRQVDLGIPDGQSYSDVSFWDDPSTPNIIATLNRQWFINDITQLQLINALNYRMVENSSTNQNESFAVIGGDSEFTEYGFSSQNVFRKIVEFTNTFTSSSTTYNIPFYELGDDPTNIRYKLKNLYNFKGTVSYNDGDDEIQPLESVLNVNNYYVFLDTDTTSPTYNYYVLQIQPRNSSPILNHSTKFLISFEFSTSDDENANT